tara:strand:+ start:7079 stop:7666 length:588 start_codon:yes stop_codon:yes gene_type:complete
MPKKSKVVEYEIAMSDDEENIKVKLPEKKVARKKIERSEEAKQAMLQRLEQGRKKAFEVRMQNKANREKVKVEEQEKTEKVSTYLKHEDIFEKKYSSKFEKLEEILSGIDNNFREIKEYKKQKREKQALDKEEKVPAVTTPIPPTNNSNVHPLPPDLITKEQRPTSSGIATYTPLPVTTGIPNYSLMKFGRRNNY